MMARGDHQLRVCDLYFLDAGEGDSRRLPSRNSRGATGATRTSLTGDPARRGSTFAPTTNAPSSSSAKVIEASPPSRLVISWANASQAEDPAAQSRGNVRYRRI